MTFSLPSRCRRRRCCLSSLFCLKLQWSSQQKRATCFATLLQNELKSDVCAFFAHVQTCLATNQVVESCVNSNFFLHGSYVTFAKTFALDWQSAQHLPILLKNVELYCPLSATIFRNLQQLTWFAARQVWARIRLVLQQCLKTTSCTFFAARFTLT